MQGIFAYWLLGW